VASNVPMSEGGGGDSCGSVVGSCKTVLKREAALTIVWRDVAITGFRNREKKADTINVKSEIPSAATTNILQQCYHHPLRSGVAPSRRPVQEPLNRGRKIDYQRHCMPTH
jgi:hypothetical protein